VKANLSVNPTAQSCALGSLHASGILAAGYLQRYASRKNEVAR